MLSTYIMNIRINSFAEKFLTNKSTLKCLEKISEHGTSFVAGTSFVMSTTIRPLAISLTPDTQKENKNYAIANSFGSGIVKFAMVEAVALPIENAIKKIDKNPNKYLNSKTLKHLAKSPEKISTSKAYKFMTQFMKLGAGLFMAIPKSFLTVALIPLFLTNQSIDKKPNNKNTYQDITFTGKISNSMPKFIAKIINNEHLQNLAIKHQTQDKNLSKYMSATTDTILTGSAAMLINKSDKIEKDRKKPLIYNNLISTAITIIAGLTLDKAISKAGSNLVEKFEHLNLHNPKLPKFIEGINILRPTLIFAGIYYGILPIFSTFIAEKTDNFINKSNKV